VPEVVLSDKHDSRLTVRDGQWVVVDGAGRSWAIEGFVGALPLLERAPAEVVGEVSSVGGPPFPYDQVLVTALNSDSGYWQEQALPWLAALRLEPDGALADAARGAIDRKQAGQRQRQQLFRWLEGQPVRLT
jgi:hypothetical protein